MIRTVRMRVYPGPCQGVDAIDEVLALSRRFKNKLTEIQRHYRALWCTARREAAPAYAAAEEAYEAAAAAVEALEEDLKGARAKARKGGQTVPPELSEARAKKKAAAEALKAERGKIDPAVLKAISVRLQREEAEAVKAATAESGLTSPAAYEAKQDLLRAKKTAGPEGPRFRRHDGGGTIPIQIPAVGMSDRVVLEALKAADLHASAARALTDAGRIQLVRGRPPVFVTDELREDGTRKTVELAQGLQAWRETPEAAPHHGHAPVAHEAALATCTPLRTWGDFTSGRLSGVALGHLPRAEWRKHWPKGRGDRPGQPLPDPRSRRRGDEKIAYGLLEMVVDRDKHRAVIPVCEPRERLPPPGAQVKQVELHRRRLGVGRDGQVRYRYSILTTVDDPRPRPSKKPGVVAVNIGWRPRPDGHVRCGYFVGDDGQHGEIVVPKEILEALQHADSLRAIRDRAFDLAKAELSQFLSALAEPPAWLIEVLRRKPRPSSTEPAPTSEEDVVDAQGGFRPKYILLWRDAQRLVRLIRAWTDNRLPGDEALFQRLAGPLLQENGQDRCWLRQHYHLLSWEQDARRKALARRQALFQGWGKRLGERYGTLLLEDFDLSAERRKPQPEEGTQKEKTPLVKLMNAAAPGELRRALSMGMEARGGQVDKETVPLATQRCHRCGSEERWDAARSSHHVCRACGAAWDQDENNCKNRLAHYARKREADGEAPPPA